MRRRAIVLASAVGFVALLALAIGFGGAVTVQNDLTRQTTEILHDAGIDAEVTFSGRDATIVVNEPLPDSVLRTLNAADGIQFDVRSIEVVVRPPVVTTTSTPTTTPPTTSSTTTTTTSSTTTTTTSSTTTTAVPGPPTVDVRAVLLSDGSISLDGTVLSVIEQAALVIGAENAVGTGKVVNRLIVAEGGDTLIGDPQVAGLVRVVELFGSVLSPAEARVADNLLRVTATSVDERGLQALDRVGAVARMQGVLFDTTDVRRA